MQIPSKLFLAKINMRRGTHIRYMVEVMAIIPSEYGKSLIFEEYSPALKIILVAHALVSANER